MSTIQSAYSGLQAHGAMFPAAAGSPRHDSGDGNLKVGTYNLGAGNDDARKGFVDTSRHLANQVVNEGVDIVALQEIDVGTSRAMEATGIDDYNQFVLAQVSAEEAGLQGDVTYSRVSIDEHGRQLHYQPDLYPTTLITGIDADGRTSQVTITEEYYTEEGARVDAGDPGAVITVYDADVRSQGGSTSYALVFGSSISHDGGRYGNGVLLGPEAALQRDADGNAVVQRHDLGANDPGGDQENRTALAVGITHGGEQATIVSTHFSAGGGADEAREVQRETLGTIAEGYGENTIVLGDFNSEPSALGRLEGDNGSNIRPGSERIDRIYTSDDVASSDRTHVNGGESDHALITWDVALDA